MATKLQIHDLIRLGSLALRYANLKRDFLADHTNVTTAPVKYGEEVLNLKTGYLMETLREELIQVQEEIDKLIEIDYSGRIMPLNRQ